MIRTNRGQIAAVVGALLPILAMTLGLPGSAIEPATGAPTPDGPLLCVICGYAGTADFLLNVALFAPLGAALRLSGRRAGTAVVSALALSVVIELLQLGMPGRYTTAGDILSNTLGGGLGAVLAGTGPFSLRASASLRRQAALTLLVTSVWLGTLVAFQVSFPRTAFYGQWTAELGQYESYEGEVLEATIGGEPAPSWRLRPEGRARAAILSGDTVAVTFIAGPPPPGPAPIFSIYDERQKEMLFLGADGDDLLLQVRRRAADLRFARPQLRWDGALAGVAAGDTLRLAAWRDGRTGMCARIETEEWCSAPGASEGWMLIAEPGRVPVRAWPVMDALWLGGSAAVALAWAPGLGAGAVGAGILLLLLVAGATLT